jgi:MoaA/NifB/PqqE/SkfB family radical SAM enzyme
VYFDSTYRRVYLGVNYRLRTFFGGRYAHACRPTSIAIALTERCNARCIHCDIWKNKGPEESPGLEGWKTVLTDLRNWLGPVHVVISGGEALMRPYAVDLVEYGSQIGLFVELLSNGFWDDQVKFERIARAKPGRVTISFDGIGPAHNLIRGRDNFFDKTTRCIETLRKVRSEKGRQFEIRLKTVVMKQNLDELSKIARYAAVNGLDVFYQPIEQNYSTPEDPAWYAKSETWPSDTGRAVAAVQDLIRLKQAGLPIINSLSQLNAMIPYFQDPERWRLATQAHSAHESVLLCSALTSLEICADGGVSVCSRVRPIGNVKDAPVRQIWETRPRLWVGGCCLNRDCGNDRTTTSEPNRGSAGSATTNDRPTRQTRVAAASGP